jgi:hypothetical protein
MYTLVLRLRISNRFVFAGGLKKPNVWIRLAKELKWQMSQQLRYFVLRG